MKKFFVFFLLFMPVVSMAASSVRMLGNNTAVSAAATSGTKITPVRSATTPNNSSAPRAGTLRSKSVTSGVATNNTSNSRFPVIKPVSSYTSVNVPQPQTISATANVNTDAIVNAVMQNIELQYYNKNDVYNTEEFKQAVQSVDNPRIDAVRVGTAPVRTGNLPDDYVEIWIER